MKQPLHKMALCRLRGHHESETVLLDCIYNYKYEVYEDSGRELVLVCASLYACVDCGQILQCNHKNTTPHKWGGMYDYNHGLSYHGKERPNFGEDRL